MEPKQEGKRIPKEEEQRKKPEYEKPRLTKLEDEIKWSQGGICTVMG